MPNFSDCRAASCSRHDDATSSPISLHLHCVRTAAHLHMSGITHLPCRTTAARCPGDTVCAQYGRWHPPACSVSGSLGRGNLEAEAPPNLCGEQVMGWVNGSATGILFFIIACGFLHPYPIPWPLPSSWERRTGKQKWVPAIAKATAVAHSSFPQQAEHCLLYNPGL